MDSHILEIVCFYHGLPPAAGTVRLGDPDGRLGEDLCS